MPCSPGVPMEGPGGVYVKCVPCCLSHVSPSLQLAWPAAAGRGNVYFCHERRGRGLLLSAPGPALQNISKSNFEY